MNQFLTKTKSINFEEFGFQTMLNSHDEDSARHICALHIYAYADGLQPELAGLNARIQQNRGHAAALQDCLYDRPIPVNDAAMLTRSTQVRITVTLAALAAIACFAGNTTTFYLFGMGLPLTLLLAAGTTALPVVVGHSAYEKILAGHKGLQVLVVLAAVALCAGGIFELAQARQSMVDKASETTPAATSYVDDGASDAFPDPALKPREGFESEIRQTLAKPCS